MTRRTERTAAHLERTAVTEPAPHLSEDHRNTLYHLERHPTSHNLEWHDVIGLLREVATVTEEHDGKVRVEAGGETVILSPPRHKDVDEEMVLAIRRLLRHAGYPTAEADADPAQPSADADRAGG